MHQNELDKYKTKTTKGIIFLSLRNFAIQGISTLGFFLLTVLLGAEEVGLFAIVAESVAILGYFSDIGLASALIQQKEKPTAKQLRTTFLIQQLLVLTALSVVAYIYPRISSAKGYGPAEMWILISLCFSFLAASLKTIPSILLERNLNFQLLSAIDIIENLSFYLIAVILAFLDFGVYSYAYAAFIRSLLGLIIIYQQSPWPIGLEFSWPTAKALLRYGIPFQINSFIAVAKDRLSNLLVAGIIGRASFGILSWAQKGPRIPLGLMDAIMKVTFPAFSRFREDHDLLRRSIERTIFYIAFFVFPMLSGIALLAPDLILLIPKYSKWSPAVLPLYLYAINAAIAAVTTPLTNAFNAVGKVTLTTKFMLMWTILTWLFFPLLSIRFGYIGTAYAAILVGSSSVVVWFFAWRLFKINVFRIILHPLISSLIMIFILLIVQYFTPPSYLLLFGKILIGVLFYSLYQYLFCRSQLYWFWQKILCSRQ